jgi:hypothetical protein
VPTGYRDAPEPPPPPEKGPYSDFNAFARARGVPYAGAFSLVVDDEQRRIVLSYSLNSGSVNGYDVTVPIAITPELIVRDENDTDRKGKERGINREVQVGDEEFDRKVYIESEARDAAVLSVLQLPVRRAILRLLSLGAHSINFASKTVTFNIPSVEGRNVFEPAAIDEVIHATRGFVHIPPTSALRLREDVPGSGTETIVIILTLISVPAMIAALINFPTEGTWLQWVAALLGFSLWLLSRRWFARATSGHSTSYRRYLYCVWFSFVGFPVASIALLVTINGGFDRAPAIVRKGEITSVEHGEDTHITVRWEGGATTTTSRFYGLTTVSRGARVLGTFHPGTLTAEWRDQPLEVLSSEKPYP